VCFIRYSVVEENPTAAVVKPKKKSKKALAAEAAAAEAAATAAPVISARQLPVQKVRDAAATAARQSTEATEAEDASRVHNPGYDEHYRVAYHAEVARLRASRFAAAVALVDGMDVLLASETDPAVAEAVRVVSSFDVTASDITDAADIYAQNQARQLQSAVAAPPPPSTSARLAFNLDDMEHAIEDNFGSYIHLIHTVGAIEDSRVNTVLQATTNAFTTVRMALARLKDSRTIAQPMKHDYELAHSFALADARAKELWSLSMSMFDVNEETGAIHPSDDHVSSALEAVLFYEPDETDAHAFANNYSTYKLKLAQRQQLDRRNPTDPDEEVHHDDEEPVAVHLGRGHPSHTTPPAAAAAAAVLSDSWRSRHFDVEDVSSMHSYRSTGTTPRSAEATTATTTTTTVANHKDRMMDFIPDENDVHTDPIRTKEVLIMSPQKKRERIILSNELNVTVVTPADPPVVSSKSLNPPLRVDVADLTSPSKRAVPITPGNSMIDRLLSWSFFSFLFECLNVAIFES
jgi:hypothetical protein